MIDEKKLEELRALSKFRPESGERFDFGGLPLADIWDTLERLWEITRAARHWQLARPGRDSSVAEFELVKLLDALLLKEK